MRRVGADRTAGDPSFTQRPRRSCGAWLATLHNEGRLSSELQLRGLFKTRFFEHRVPRQDCGETWQMATCARPHCGGPCRPEARVLFAHFYHLSTFINKPESAITDIFSSLEVCFSPQKPDRRLPASRSSSWNKPPTRTISRCASSLWVNRTG